MDSWNCFETAMRQSRNYHGLSSEAMICHWIATETSSLHSTDKELSGNGHARKWDCRVYKAAPWDAVSFMALRLDCHGITMGLPRICCHVLITSSWDFHGTTAAS